jgi:hypothetical protein
MKTPLFLTGFVQVYFVAVNTYFIAKEMYIGVFIASFVISLVWSFNVRKIAFGTLSHRLMYALGAAVGSIAGLLSAGIITNIFKP